MAVDHRQHPKLLWGIVAALVLAIAVFFVISQWILQHNEQIPSHQEDSIVKAPSPAAPVDAELTAASQATPQVLVDESLLTAPVSENATLAQEELAKLADLQAQLTDQSQSLTAQHQDADELIKLKEQQLQLLEAQLSTQ